MIILHATFLEGKFFLWGEMPEEPETIAAKRPRNKSNLRGNPANPKPLRFDAGVEKLSSGLKEIGFDFKVIKKSTRTMDAGFQPWTTNLSLPPHSSVSLRNLLKRQIWFLGK